MSGLPAQYLYLFLNVDLSLFHLRHLLSYPVESACHYFVLFFHQINRFLHLLNGQLEPLFSVFVMILICCHFQKEKFDKGGVEGGKGTLVLFEGVEGGSECGKEGVGKEEVLHEFE